LLSSIFGLPDSPLTTFKEEQIVASCDTSSGVDGWVVPQARRQQRHVLFRAILRLHEGKTKS
jgi:hypothetical protein